MPAALGAPIHTALPVDDLLLTLKTTFGYGAFRPLQREIIETALADQDVFALLPTGGGKSLCFQLPALLRPGLTVVVSPLIALMKDQVDQLQAAGVAATYLNSTLDADEARSRLSGLHRGEWRLLYVAPECSIVLVVRNCARRSRVLNFFWSRRAISSPINRARNSV